MWGFVLRFIFSLRCIVHLYYSKRIWYILILIATILLACPLDREILCCHMTIRFLVPQGCQLCARASFVEMRPRYRSFIIGRYTIAPFTPKLKHVKKLFS